MPNELYEHQDNLDTTDLLALDSALDEAGVRDIPTGIIKTEGDPAAAPNATDTGLRSPGVPSSQAAPGGGAADPDLNVTATARASGGAEGGTALDGDPDKIAQPTNLSPASTRNWNSLRKMASDQKKRAEALEKDVEALKAQIGGLQAGGVGDPKLAERLKVLEGELEGYRRIYQTENSPEFKAKYDSAMAANNTAIIGILKRHGIDDGNLKKVQDAGGLANVPALYTIVVNRLSAAEGNAQYVMQANLDADSIRSLTRSNIELSAQRQQELDSIPGNRENFTAAQKEVKRQEWLSYEQEFNSRFDVMTKDIPYARLQEIPATATPEQKKLIEANNDICRFMEPRFRFAKYPPNASARCDVALRYCMSMIQEQQIKESEEKLKKMEERAIAAEKRLNDIKQKSVIPNGGPAPFAQTKITTNDKLGMTNEDAIESGLREIGA